MKKTNRAMRKSRRASASGSEPALLRKKLDELDRRLVALLNERQRVAVELGKIEMAAGIFPSEPLNMAQRIAQLQDTARGLLSREVIEAIYREIESAAFAAQRPVAVAYLGPAATFTHQAARKHFGGSARYMACETITDVFAEVEKRGADYGVVPIENSTEGAVTHTLDEFVSTPLKICAETYLPIAHHLLSKVPKEKIRKVFSKPEVFGQCRRWLHENLPGVELIPVSSTARGAEMAAREKTAGALAGDLAAELYGLNILARDVQDLGGNTTRFLIIGRDYPPPTGNDKTSIFFAVKHRVGALHDALGTFKQYGINMTKIESRPSKTRAWEYYFFVDVEGHADEPRVKKALAEMSEHCTLMTVLGAYPRASGVD